MRAKTNNPVTIPVRRPIFSELTRSLRRTCRFFDLMGCTDYIDESYNSQTLCVGGWLATTDTWDALGDSWKLRIAHENRISAKKGFPPISRYHATDCANLKREFAEHKGWDIPRQVRLTKRLCQIIGRHGPSEPVGLVVGGGIADFKRHYPDKDFKRSLYKLSVTIHLLNVGEAMSLFFPNDRVTVYYDRERDFGPLAREAFDQFMSDPGVAHWAKYFVTMAPLGWEDAVQLQPADLLAYEGMKRLHRSMRGNDYIQKSLKALIGDVPIIVQQFSDFVFADLVRMADNLNAGKPLNQGVHSKLKTL